jgi:hypothetical protein
MSAWSTTALRVLVPIVGLLLVVQYVLGLLTNAYAPAAGFTSNSTGNYLDAHYSVGYILGILALLIFVVACFTRRARVIVLALVVLLGVVGAGLEGMHYVSTTPNDPTATVGMGLLFLIAFGAAMMLARTLYRGHRMMSGLGGGAPSASS